jgi:DNA repair protein RadB
MKTDRRSSGNAAMDQLLGGGLEVRTITQFYGEPASGKSTLCMIAAVTSLRAGQTVVFIDSEGFSIERFRQIAGTDTEKIADRLFLFEPIDFEQQGSMIAEAEKILKVHKPGLLVMDSATALYRNDLERGRDSIQMLTRQMIHLLGY